MRQRLGWMLGILLSLSAVASPALADEDRLAEIRFLEGAWNAQRYLLDAEQNWVATQQTKINFLRLYGRNYLQARLDLPDVQWQMILGRDPLQGRYRFASMNGDNGQLAVFEGHFSETDGLVVDNAATNTAFKGAKGNYYLRYRFRLMDDERVVLTTFRAQAREMEWRPVSRVVFTRP